MTEDEMFAEIGITKEEYEEAFLRLCDDGYLERKLDDDGEIRHRRTEKPFHKLEWVDAHPRICQIATDIITKVLPMLDKELNEEFEDTLRRMERDGLIESELGDDGEIYIVATKKLLSRPKRDDADTTPYLLNYS